MKGMKSMALGLVAISLLTLSSCSITLPVGAGTADVQKGGKTGTAKATSVFGLCFGCDASVKTAAANGRIVKISTVDMNVKNILGVVIIYETIVTGEGK